MLKKMVILAVVGFVAVTALASTKVGSYIRAEIKAMRERAEDSVPPEKEIGRLRNELKMLDKDMVKVVEQLAKERVAVHQLEEQINLFAEKQNADKDRLNGRAAAIKNAEGQVTFGKRTMTISEAKAELETDVKRYTINQKSLESMEQTLALRIKNRDTLEKQLETLKNQKVELAVAIDALETELASLKLQQMESKYQTDDTRLAKIKEDLRKLKTKVEVEREKLKLMPAVHDDAPPAASNKSVDDIMAPLSGSGKAEVKLPHAD